MEPLRSAALLVRPADKIGIDEIRAAHSKPSTDLHPVELSERRVDKVD